MQAQSDPGASAPSIHASCVAIEGRGLLITGASGSGKSGLALQLIALGAQLVADDRCLLSVRDQALWASCPAPIRGLIEARYLGILQLAPLPEVRLLAEVCLDRTETERLPEIATQERHGISLPRLNAVPGLHFASALYLYMKAVRIN